MLAQRERDLPRRLETRQRDDGRAVERLVAGLEEDVDRTRQERRVAFARGDLRFEADGEIARLALVIAIRDDDKRHAAERIDLSKIRLGCGERIDDDVPAGAFEEM